MLFGKKKTTSTSTSAPVERVTTVLGPGINWKGNLRGKGGVRVEGTLEGEIAVRGLVIIGETGRVTCKTFKADTVIIAGTVKGEIISAKLTIRATGRVFGDVITQSFSTDEGAFLRGKVTMEDKVDLSDLPTSGETAQDQDKAEDKTETKMEEE